MLQAFKPYKTAMKYLIGLSIVLLSLKGKGQTIVRQSGESKEQLLSRLITANARNGGAIYEQTSDTFSMILYFQIQTQDAKPFDTSGFRTNPFLSHAVGTRTLFNVLYSSDGISYAMQVVDTLVKNAGYGPCWLPVTINSIFPSEHTNDPDAEFCFELSHNVWPDCSSVTYLEIRCFKGLKTFLTSKNQAPLEIRKNVTGMSSDPTKHLHNKKKRRYR